MAVRFMFAERRVKLVQSWKEERFGSLYHALLMCEIMDPYTLFVQISQQLTHIQAYIRTQKLTRSYTEEYLHGTKWPIDRPTNTAADTATASAEASVGAPNDALVDAPA